MYLVVARHRQVNLFHQRIELLALGNLEQGGKQITLETCQIIALAQAHAQIRRNHAQQAVGDVLAVQLRNRVEAPNFDQHQCVASRATLALANRLGEAILEDDPVVEPGERIALGHFL